MQPGLYSANRKPEYFGSFLVAQSLQVAQYYNHALGLAYMVLQGAQNAPSKLPAVNNSLRLAGGVRYLECLQHQRNMGAFLLAALRCYFLQFQQSGNHLRKPG